ncbi:early nodulin-like protein 18 [Prunus dulcis]|uniref:Early nodulin-like protein 18 n=1 Tax=Prunus dulcis TaxID=3755 RepID=A0A4Y1QZZ6_PRUDU|nr:early nodulin-like protein 18 [Prunus dulcis]
MRVHNVMQSFSVCKPNDGMGILWKLSLHPKKVQMGMTMSWIGHKKNESAPVDPTLHMAHNREDSTLFPHSTAACEPKQRPPHQLAQLLKSLQKQIGEARPEPAMANPTVIVILIAITATAAAAAAPPATQYTNHTVGGPPAVFNTSTNQTVIETYNETAYRGCTPDDDSFEYGGGSNAFGEAQTIAVPLTLEGPAYYFSGAGDGEQCQQGMAFAIQVNKGLGLPPILNQPPPPPYSEPPSASTQSPPMTVAGDQTPGNGGMRSGANMREGRGYLKIIYKNILELGRDEKT